MEKRLEFCNPDCKALFNIGVPVESGQWLELGYLMRTISDTKNIPETQKEKVQNLLIDTFKKKNYFPEQYAKVISDIEKIRHIPCRERVQGLEELVDGMSRAISGMSKDVGKIAKKQVTNISEMKDTAELLLTNVKKNRPRSEILPLVEKLKKNCKVAFNDIAKIQKTLEEDATFDTLTSLYNRKSFDEMLLRSVERFKAGAQPLSLIFIDIDYFKKINDEYGHQVGDQVLNVVSREVKDNVRKSDCVARYGGEEIVVVLEGMGLEASNNRADKIRKSIETHEFIIRNFEKNVDITVSLGVAECREEWKKISSEEIASKLIGDADSALYQAKNSGRNKVCAA